MAKNTFTRRDFLKAAAAAPVAGALAGRLRGAGRSPTVSRVVLVRDERALRGFKRPDPEIVSTMLDQALKALLETADAAEAWARIIRPGDVVGIKTNVMHYLPTTSEVEEVIKRKVLATGIPEKDIGIDDRGVRNHPVFKRATALINVRPARTHHWSGIGGCIKNYITFTPDKPRWHPDACADLAQIWKEFDLIGKTRLNILLMLNPQFHSVGPHSYSDKYVWDYRGILVSRDPVAADAVGLRIIQAKRKRHFGRDVPLATSAKHIRLAETRHGLGAADPARIELLKLGWQANLLI